MLARKPTLLIVGEDPGVTKTLRTLGLSPVLARQPQEALLKAKHSAPQGVLINLPGQVVEEAVLQELSRIGHVVLILADPGSRSGEGSPGNGQIQVLTRPVRETDLHAALRRVLGRDATNLREVSSRPSSRYMDEYAPLFGGSPAMRAIKKVIEQVADTNATVLIRGESGVGKALVARAIHFASPRSDQPFLKVNCAALPAELLESELFGHEKGTFTGAYRRKLGKFEFANKGTLLLDEIGELPLALQAKLLHVLQDHEFSRLGGRDSIRVDTRVLASTNRDLEAALASGQFREDLYYRLNVVEIRVPALRDRREEIPLLVATFLEAFQQQYEREVTLPAETVAALTEYSWPGNVRELENLVRRLVVLGNVRQIHEEILTRRRDAPAEAPVAPPAQQDPSMGLKQIARLAARDAERAAIQEVLDRVRWNRTKAARLLKISYKTLLSKITECGLAPKHSRRRP